MKVKIKDFIYILTFLIFSLILPLYLVTQLTNQISNSSRKEDNVKIDINNEKPIFIQIAEGVEDGILTGIFPEEEQIPSITEFSVNYKINPATALKGINLLVDENIIFKKRGVGMFVTKGAVKKLKQKRQNQFYDNYISKLIDEAKRLGITGDEIIAMVERGFSK